MKFQKNDIVFIKPKNKYGFVLNSWVNFTIERYYIEWRESHDRTVSAGFYIRELNPATKEEAEVFELFSV